MSKRIGAIVFIYVCTSIGWMILAGTVLVRTEGQGLKLKRAVGRLWGTMQAQQAPVARCAPPSLHSEAGSYFRRFLLN